MAGVNNYTLKAMGYAAVSLVLLVLSLTLSSNFLLVISLISLGLVLLSTGFIPRVPSMERELEDSVIYEGEEVKVSLEIKKTGGLGHLEILDTASPALEISSGSNHMFLPPRRGRMEYSVRSPLRGYHEIGPLIIRRWDPLWLWFREERIDSTDRITTFPRLVETRGVQKFAGPNKQRPGAMHLKMAGLGKEFYSIRDYVTTDPYSTINWKAYARTGRLKVNQYEAESISDIVFILDARRVTRVGDMVDNPLEREVRLCASMVSQLLGRANRVGLVTYGTSVSVIKPQGGNGQRTNLLHYLTDLTPAGYNTLGATVHYSLSYIPPEAEVILLSPLSEDPTIKEGVKALRERGHSVVIISPSGLEFERKVLNNLVSPRYLIKLLNRRNLMKDLEGMGGRTVDWGPDRDIRWAMEEAFG